MAVDHFFVNAATLSQFSVKKGHDPCVFTKVFLDEGNKGISGRPGLTNGSKLRAY